VLARVVEHVLECTLDLHGGLHGASEVALGETEPTLRRQDRFRFLAIRMASPCTPLASFRRSEVSTRRWM
jgi:hypothetical protein